MKKIITLIICFSIIFMFGACNNNTSDSGSNLESNVKIAGEDVKYIRTGPAKYFTLSFDDGSTEDDKLIALLKKYNVKCTFNINTGLLNDFGAITVSGYYPRYQYDVVKNGVYDGFEVAVHTLSHISLIQCEKDEVIKQVRKDSDNILTLTNIKPIGMAYPGGSDCYDENTVKIILENTNIRYARTTTETGNFGIPTSFMNWNPTCGALNANLSTLAEQFVSAKPSSDMLFYVWGHSWEITANNKWTDFEEFLKTVSGKEDIVYITNAEFYQLFKTEISK